MGTTEVVRGYKVFKSDWTCRGKQYACPGKFEEDVEIGVCSEGMHFCKKPIFCFKYYEFDPDNKVAEVIAYGKVDEKDDKCYTDKLEIVREIPWSEVLEIVNAGEDNAGYGNSGDNNLGNWNGGHYNTGDKNSGDYNTGDKNTGSHNTGNHNSGNGNSGCSNTGDCNAGNRNSGHDNTGSSNSGSDNSGDYNSGNYNSGDYNSGNRNSGDYNSGNRNSGDWNSGDWNKCSFSNGCFNTINPKIYLFDKPSEWTYQDWFDSDARYLLKQIPGDVVKYVSFSNMTDEEKEKHPEAKVAGGYLKKLSKREAVKLANQWWRGLTNKERDTIMAIPNFDKDIFLEITGIDVTKE